MTKIPKVTKSNYNKLFPTFKKNQIIQFATTINEDDSREMATNIMIEKRIYSGF
jgi:hypothetical protein